MHILPKAKYANETALITPMQNTMFIIFHLEEIGSWIEIYTLVKGIFLSSPYCVTLSTIHTLPMMISRHVRQIRSQTNNPE